MHILCTVFTQTKSIYIVVVDFMQQQQQKNRLLNLNLQLTYFARLKNVHVEIIAMTSLFVISTRECNSMLMHFVF